MPNRNIIFDQPIQVTTNYDLPSNTQINLSPGVLVPFSVGTGDGILLECDSTGDSHNVILIGSGQSSSQSLALTNGTFTQLTNYICSFIMPYDATLQNIHMATKYYSNDPWTPSSGTRYIPYVALATAIDSNTFTILPETVTRVNSAFEGGTQYPSNTVVLGNQENLALGVAAGTKVAIVCGLTGSSSSSSNLTAAFSFYGCLWLT